MNGNGTIGVDDFAVYASVELGTGYKAYKAFDEDSSAAINGGSFGTPNNYEEKWIGWYTKNPVKIIQYTFRNSTTDTGGSYAIKTGRLEYSHDGITWAMEVPSITNTVGESAAYWNLTVENPVFSRYKRLVSTTVQRGGNYWYLANINFSEAVELVGVTTYPEAIRARMIIKY